MRSPPPRLLYSVFDRSASLVFLYPRRLCPTPAEMGPRPARSAPMAAIRRHHHHSSLDTAMKSPLAMILVVAGLALLLYGLGSADSIKDSFSRLFTGHPTDRTMWLIVGGCVCTVVGLAGFWRSSR